MPDLHRTLFISDLHLDENHPEIIQPFFDLLAYPNVDALYILGDLFEAWIGDDDDSPYLKQIIQALHAATQRGLPIYVLHGNRDFLLGNAFLAATGCQLLPDETVIQLYGKPVLLMHGDTLCTRDEKYIKARKILRNAWLKKMFLYLPLRFRKKISLALRAKSMAHTQHANLEIMDVTQAEVERVMVQYDVEVLIHGHTHRPNFHEFKLKNKPVLRIVLGAWHEHGNMLVWDELGNKEWLEIKK